MHRGSYGRDSVTIQRVDISLTEDQLLALVRQLRREEDRLPDPLCVLLEQLNRRLYERYSIAEAEELLGDDNR